MNTYQPSLAVHIAIKALTLIFCRKMLSNYSSIICKLLL